MLSRCPNQAAPAAKDSRNALRVVGRFGLTTIRGRPLPPGGRPQLSEMENGNMSSNLNALQNAEAQKQAELDLRQRTEKVKDALAGLTEDARKRVLRDVLTELKGGS